MHSVQARLHLIRDSVSTQTIHTEIEGAKSEQSPVEKPSRGHALDTLCGVLRTHQKTPAWTPRCDQAAHR